MLTHSILPIDFCTHLLLEDRQILQSTTEDQENKQPQKSLSEKYIVCAYPGCQKKWDLSYTSQEKSGQSHNFFFEKRGLIYLAALKMVTIFFFFFFCCFFLRNKNFSIIIGPELIFFSPQKCCRYSLDSDEYPQHTFYRRDKGKEVLILIG